MTSTLKSIVVCCVVFVSFHANAQLDANSKPKWGLETELVQPFIPEVGIIRLQGTYTLKVT
jgi:hypothetical protein